MNEQKVGQRLGRLGEWVNKGKAKGSKVIKRGKLYGTYYC